MLLGTESDFLQSAALKFTDHDVVICGTFAGDDVRAIKQVRPNAHVVVVDSFLGLAKPSFEDTSQETVQAGECNIGGVEKYKSYFKNKSELPDEIYQMWITPENLMIVKSRPISILFLDLDHYQPTKVCLDYFKFMLVNKSVIIVHDYGFHRCPGVKIACEQFGGTWTGVPGCTFGVQIK